MRDRMPSHLKIYGVSHIVLSSPDIEKLSDFLSSFSYHPIFNKVKNKNPKEKEPFIDGPIAELTITTLMTTNNTLPPFELLQEDFNHTNLTIDAPPSFIFAFIEEKNKTYTAEAIHKKINFQDKGNLFQGFQAINKSDLNNGTLALYIPCSNLKDAVDLWEFIGLTPYIENDLARVRIEKTLVGQSLSLYFIPQVCHKSKMWLNQQGIVCTSFLCNDAKKIRNELKSKKYEVGECFKLKPFDRTLNIFFMRNHSGEIYEFLSPE